MSLSNSTKLHLLDPTVHNSTRSEFRIPYGHLSSAMHLFDFGVWSAAGANGEFFYGSRSGVLGAVKSIALYSGAQLLDEVQELNSWAAIQHMLTSNSYAEDVNRFDVLNGTNAKLETIRTTGQPKYTFQPRLADYAASFPLDANSAALSENTVRHDQLNIPTSEEGTSGICNLQRYMGLLQSTAVLPPIPDLRIVITWNLNAAQYFSDNNAPGAVAVSGIQNFRPSLAVEEMLGVPDTMDYKIPYYNVITERFTIAQAANGTQVATNLRSGAFRQRMLQDLVLMNRPSQAVNDHRSYEVSLAQSAEQIQLVVNGRNWLPEKGIDNPAMKMRYATETLGSMNASIAGYLPSLTDAGAIFSDSDIANRPSSQDNSTWSLAAVKIGTVIERLDIEYTRTGFNNATIVPNNVQTTPFTLLAFGKCAAMMEIKNGKIRVSY